MKILNLASLPELAQSSEWARLLQTYPSTLTRAYKSGSLRGSKIGRRTLLFARDDILDWLGVKLIAEVPPPSPPPPMRYIVTKPRAKS